MKDCTTLSSIIKTKSDLLGLLKENPLADKILNLKLQPMTLVIQDTSDDTMFTVVDKAINTLDKVMVVYDSQNYISAQTALEYDSGKCTTYICKNPEQLKSVLTFIADNPEIFCNTYSQESNDVFDISYEKITNDDSFYSFY